MRVYYDRDADLNLVKGKKIAVIGYGSQGHAHALNLRDSGVKEVAVALRKTSAGVKKAEGEKLKVMEVAEAAKWADVMMMLTPDELQADIYNDHLVKNMKQGAALMFAHGLNVHFNLIEPRADLDVMMIAPKGPGHTVRSEYQRGAGVPCLLAVHADKSGNAVGEAAGSERITQRDLQTFGTGRLDHEIGGARAHGGNHIVDAAMGGLHDDGHVAPRLAHARQHAEPVEVGHHQIEHDAVDARAGGAGEQGCGHVAALGQQGPVAEALHHGFQQAALHRIVVDDEHAFGHETPHAVPIWCNVAGLA